MKSRQDFITDAEWWEYYRQYSAAMAMQGMLAYNHRPDFSGWDRIAKESVQAADALINALNQQQ